MILPYHPDAEIAAECGGRQIPKSFPRLTVRRWLLGYGDGSYHRTSPALLVRRVRHRLTGLRRGCSCTRCFNHPSRRVPAADLYAARIENARLRDELRKADAEGRERIAEFAVAISQPLLKPEARQCRCIHEAHCQWWTRTDCRLRAGATISDGGGICGPTCSRLLVGCGDDTYDPLCTLVSGHEGPCRALSRYHDPSNPDQAGDWYANQPGPNAEPM